MVGALTRIVNRGTIEGRNDGGIDHLAGEALVINRGTIVGPTYGYDGDDDRDELQNFGAIVGGVFTFAQNDLRRQPRGDRLRRVRQRQRRLYRARHRPRRPGVDGDGGRDTLESSRADDLFIGGGSRRFLRLRPPAAAMTGSSTSAARTRSASAPSSSTASAPTSATGSRSGRTAR